MKQSMQQQCKTARKMTMLAVIVLSAVVGAGRPSSHNSLRTSSVHGDMTVRANGFLKAKDELSLQRAIVDVLGHDYVLGAKPEMRREIERVLAPVWKSLAKNSLQRVDWQQVRYLVYRYFMKKDHFQIRGFEPIARFNRSTSEQSSGLMNSHLQVLGEAILHGRSGKNGFTMDDVLILISKIDEIVHDYERHRLEHAYNVANKSTAALLDETETQDILEMFVIYWILTDEPGFVVEEAIESRATLEVVVPIWPEIVNFIRGEIRTRKCVEERNGTKFASPVYSFEDIFAMVTKTTRSFASFWRSECGKIKTSLAELGAEKTGRVYLSKFYKSALDGTWQFGESEQYLRALGAIDDSSQLGPQVIVANYLQGTSNCVSRSSYYHSCCANECDAVLEQLEIEIGAPVATPDEVREVMLSMSGFDGNEPLLTSSLSKQLNILAERHGSKKIPLHSRHFAQWLHYVFPMECGMPPKTASDESLRTPGEFGQTYFAEIEAVKIHAVHHAKNESSVGGAIFDDEAFEQWMEDDDNLIGDYSLELTAPWESSRLHTCIKRVGLVLILALGGMAAHVVAGNSRKCGGKMVSNHLV